LIQEHDELRLPDDIQSIKVLALSTNCRYLVRDLIVMVRLRTTTSSQIRELFGAEFEDVDTIDFTPEACAAFLASGAYQREGHPQSHAPIADFSMAGILTGVISEFGLPAAIAGLAAAATRLPKRPTPAISRP
jgi:hypothetical protein